MTMLRACVVLVLVATFVSCYNVQRNSNWGQDLYVVELITRNGYPVENFTVQTSDGYLLDLIRIPRGLRGWNQQNAQQGLFSGQENSNQNRDSSSDDSDSNESSQSRQRGWSNRWANKNNNQRESQSDESTNKWNQQGNKKDSGNRPAVLLMHGLLSSADDFVIGGPSQGLAYILADNGFDVFLGNTRGNVYGRRHTVLNPEKDAAFWRFCFHEMGTKDLPAIIDRILEVTGKDRISYIGEMQGSTVFFVMASEVPQYISKITSAVAMGPVAFMGKATNPMMRLVAENLNSRGFIVRNLGQGEFKPSTELLESGGEQECIKSGIVEKVCKNPFFLVNGFNSRMMNTTTMMSLINRVPAGASSKQIIHYAQLVKSGRFVKFSIDGSENREEYDLKKVTVPVAVFYTAQDALSNEDDVSRLIKELPNVKVQKKIEQMSNNLDMLYANDVEKLVYVDVIRALYTMQKPFQN